MDIKSVVGEPWTVDTIRVKEAEEDIQSLRNTLIADYAVESAIGQACGESQ